MALVLVWVTVVRVVPLLVMTALPATVRPPCGSADWAWATPALSSAELASRAPCNWRGWRVAGAARTPPAPAERAAISETRMRIGWGIASEAHPQSQAGPVAAAAPHDIAELVAELEA